MADVLSQAGDFLAATAPKLATLFGGPLAGTAVAALEGVFGITPAPGASVDDRKQAVAAAMLTATPDQIVALKKTEGDLVKTLTDAGVTLEQADDADRASARQMHIATKDALTPILAMLVVLSWTFINWYELTHATADLPPAMLTIVGRVLGTLDGALMLVLAFYFGSSSGSARAQELLAKAGPVQE